MSFIRAFIGCFAAVSSEKVVHPGPMSIVLSVKKAQLAAQTAIYWSGKYKKKQLVKQRT